MVERWSHWVVAVAGTTILMFGFQNCGSLSIHDAQDSHFRPLAPEAGDAGKAFFKKLAGEWKRTCQGADNSESRLKFDTTGLGKMEIKVGYGDCKPILAAELSFRYQVGESMSLDSGETVFRLQAKDLEAGTLSPLNQDVANILNSKQYCGVNHWVANQPRRVLFGNCIDSEGSPLLQPLMARNIVFLDEDGLRMGSSQWLGSDGFPEVLEMNSFKSR